MSEAGAPGNMPTVNIELTSLVDEFFDKSDKVAIPFLSAMEKQTAPQRLYHYTNDAGLRGILESGTVWLTNVFRLNDPSELRHGVGIAADALDATTTNGPPERGLFTKHFRALQESGVEESAHYFVGSFSKTADELGQWRAYADDGRGYALGFSGLALEKAFCYRDAQQIAGNTSFPITYDDDLLKKLQSEIVALVLPYISVPRGRDLSSKDLNEYMQGLSVSYSIAALRLALFFKHPAYRHEEEYRFMQIQRGDCPAENAKIRLRPYSLVRFVEFNWRALAPLSLEEIVVGPAADKYQATSFVNDCLKAYHGDARKDVSVRSSKIPYRSVRT